MLEFRAQEAADAHRGPDIAVTQGGRSGAQISAIMVFRIPATVDSVPFLERVHSLLRDVNKMPDPVVFSPSKSYKQPPPFLSTILLALRYALPFFA